MSQVEPAYREDQRRKSRRQIPQSGADQRGKLKRWITLGQEGPRSRITPGQEKLQKAEISGDWFRKKTRKQKERGT